MTKKIVTVALVSLMPAVAFGAVGRTQSAIQNGTNVRARVNVAGIYSDECHDAYYGCMDQFCISDNTSGGSCQCSNDNAKYEDELKEINDLLTEATRIREVEVEKIKLGANADLAFNGMRTYDENGNVVYNFKTDKPKNEKSNRADLLSIFDTNIFEEEADDDDIMNKTGAALFAAADETCQKQVGAGCEKDMTFLRQTYIRQIESDCRAFKNSIAEQRAAANTAMNDAEKAVRNAVAESFNSANKYNQGECMIEFKKCMQGADVCGTDWNDCVSDAASKKMRNQSSQVGAHGISVSTIERLDAKRTMCERVLDQCMLVRDNVWNAFLRESAPAIKLAEMRAESNMRQSCLTDITQCMHKACKEDIAGKGVASMDVCLTKPDMVKSFCKYQIEPCQDMAGAEFWEYVQNKLLAMRVDACTTEVKECLLDEMRCGPDFANCIGMDYDFIHELCPEEVLVACKGWDKVDSIITGLYLNIDNKALDNCQKLVENKMMEICGSTTDCNRFASDDTIGTGSLQYQKDGAIHRVSGMISFGKINVMSGQNNSDDAGKIDIAEYSADLLDEELVTLYTLPVADRVVKEIENIQGAINRVIDMIESDQKIQYCVKGRDLKQITGEDDTTDARFPNLLNQVKMQIAVAALRQAQDNYNKKYNEYIAKATEAQSTDIANLMCNKLPFADGSAQGISSKDLNTPNALVIEFGGVSNAALAAGGTHSSQTLGKTTIDHASGSAAGASNGGALTTLGATATVAGETFLKYAALKKGGEAAAKSLIESGGASLNPYIAIADIAVKTVVALESDHYHMEFDGGSREMWSIFNRDTRVCHLCTSTITRDCTSSYKHGFLGIGRKNESNCVTNDPIEKCEDIQM